MAIFAKIAFFDNFKPPSFVSTHSQLSKNEAASSFLYIELLINGENLQPISIPLFYSLTIAIFAFLMSQCATNYTLQKCLVKRRNLLT